MKETALQLSKELRDPNGPHGVDIVIALTHCRVPNVSGISPVKCGSTNDIRTLR